MLDIHAWCARIDPSRKSAVNAPVKKVFLECNAPKLEEDLAPGADPELKMFPAPDYPSRFTDSYWTEVGNWLQDLAGGYLRATEGTEAFPADTAELTEYLWSEIRVYTGGFEVWAGRYGMTREELDTRVWDKATFVLSTFNPAIPRGFKRPFTAEERSRGGKASSKTAYMQKRLVALQALPDGLTPEEQAEELKCSIRTLWRLRGRLREQQEPKPEPTAQELADAASDAILAQMDAEIAEAKARAAAAPFPELTADAAPEADEPRITVMEPEIPTTVPTSWLHEVAEQMRREAEARVTFADFEGIEL